MGDRQMRAVSRAAADFRRGWPVRLLAAQRRWLVAPVETLDPGLIEPLSDRFDTAPKLLISAESGRFLDVEVGRARYLGLAGKGVSVLAESLRGMVQGSAADLDVIFDPEEAAAVELAKLAELLPAAWSFELRGGDFGEDLDLSQVSGAWIESYRSRTDRSIRLEASASVPLDDANACRIAAFRALENGDTHYALIIGEPRPGDPVLCRVHSECFTGDMLGSLRCDCGGQLKWAIRRMGEEGAGILLYLAHEGRGIGLLNKIRAYAFQDQGDDTIDANRKLGYAEDERRYVDAARMLDHLGFNRVRLLTNNPDKVRALEAQAIEVVERIPHALAANAYNRRYLSTKATRGGHDFATIVESLEDVVDEPQDH